MKNCSGRRLLSPRAYRGLAGAAIIVASCALRAQVVVDGAGIDFGDVSGHKVVTKTISLRSSSDRPVRITDVIKTCICADMEVSPMTIEPHGEAVVTSTLDPNVFAGPFRKTFYLRTDDPETPSLMIPVSGEVRPWWTVTPARDQTLKAAGDEARFEISCAADAPALARAAIEGIFSRADDRCRWHFQGKVEIPKDRFDFNVNGGKRSWLGQFITNIVAYMQSSLGISHDFDITFKGNRQVKDEGDCCE